MSREPYGRGGQRWDAERFNRERDQFDELRARGSVAVGFARPGERPADEFFDRRGPPTGRGYDDDRSRERVYYDEPEMPRYAARRESVTIEREREKERGFYTPDPPRRAPARPGMLRRQSSLDTFDRRPLPRFSDREEYGPPALRADYRPAYVAPVPVPRYRALPPPRRYAEREFEDIKISEPEFYGDDEYRPYPERVREREIIRTRRRSRSRSSSSSSSSSSDHSVRKSFPKRGKTRMPARLVSLKAIIDLGYPYEKEGEVVIIQKALGPENIDEVIKLSETYKKSETKVSKTTVEMSGGRSDAGEVVEARHEQIIAIPPQHGHGEVIEKTKTTVERREISPPRAVGRSRSVGRAPIIVDAHRPIEIIERSEKIPVGPLVLLDNHRNKDERSIRAEIRALEAEREALKAEKRADRELRKAELIRRGEVGDLVLYEREEEYRERRGSGGGGGGATLEVKKDKKGRMKLVVPSSKK